MILEHKLATSLKGLSGKLGLRLKDQGCSWNVLPTPGYRLSWDPRKWQRLENSDTTDHKTLTKTFHSSELIESEWQYLLHKMVVKIKFSLWKYVKEYLAVNHCNIHIFLTYIIIWSRVITTLIPQWQWISLTTIQLREAPFSNICHLIQLYAI